MMKIIAPHPNASVAPVKNALFILRPWTLPASIKGWKAYRDSIVHYRANPRSTAYMLERAREFISAHAQDASIDLFVHKDVSGEVTTKDHPWIKNILGDDELDKSSGTQYDTIVFLYADAIGIGWDNFEKKMFRFSPAQFTVINGRRRIFLWDSESRRMLRQRRFMAQAWWLEWLLAPWLLVVSAIYALADMLFLPLKKLR